MTDEKAQRPRGSIKSAFETGTTFVVLVASILVIRHVLTTPAPPRPALRPEIQLPGSAVSIEGAKLKGSEQAKVVLIEYSDFQCPFCTRFATQVLPVLEKEYVTQGKLRIAFRHLPLVSIHPHAEAAAAAAECAADQGRFWDLHDGFFRQAELTADRIAAEVARLALDQKRYDACMDADAIERVRTEAATAQRFKIASTPAFLVGEIQADGKVLIRRSIGGAQPVEQFRKAIEASLRTGG
jgi:protein-disulfide isomerase